MLRKLLVTIIVLGVLLTVADVSTKVVAEQQLTNYASSDIPPGSTVHAHIRSLPFLGRLLGTGKVTEVDFHLESVKSGALTYPAVDIRLDGVRVNRHTLIKQQKIRIRQIDGGQVSVELRPDDLTLGLGQKVFIRNAKLYVDASGRQIQVTPKMSNGQLVLAAAGIATLTLDVPQTKVVNCATASILIGDSSIRLTCRLSAVPPALIRGELAGLAR